MATTGSAPQPAKHTADTHRIPLIEQWDARRLALEDTRRVALGLSRQHRAQWLGYAGKTPSTDQFGVKSLATL